VRAEPVVVGRGGGKGGAWRLQWAGVEGALATAERQLQEGEG
jgi:hypothetical protein